MKTSFKTFDEMVRCYESVCSAMKQQELLHCRVVMDSDDFTDAERAEILLMGGHQWRLANRNNAAHRAAAIETLTNAALWKKNYQDFEELYATVEKTISQLHQIGPLACYDVAMRIGHCIGCNPERMVYLQSGALKGGMALLGTKASGRMVATETFQAFFPGLSALDIEDLLCIMKAHFKKGGVNPDVEGNFRVGNCYRWTCSPELRDKIKRHLEATHTECYVKL